MKVLIKLAQMVPNGPDDFDWEETEERSFASVRDAIEFLSSVQVKD